MRHDDVSFDDAGRPVPVVGFRYPDAESAPPRSDREAARRWVALLEWLTSGGDARRAGQRAILLAAALGLNGAPRNVRDLGRALGVSHATAARWRDKLSREIPMICRGDNG